MLPEGGKAVTPSPSELSMATSILLVDGSIVHQYDGSDVFMEVGAITYYPIYAGL